MGEPTLCCGSATGGLIEALCLPSHLDLRPVGFGEVWD